MAKTEPPHVNEKRLNLDSELAAARSRYPRIEQVTPETVLKLSLGDHAAFNTVYMTYADPMLKFLGSILRDEEDAKEAIQEVFMNLWAHREQIDPQKSIKNYLYTSTRNKAFNMLREQHVRMRYARDELSRHDDRSDLDGHELLQSKQTALLIEAVVAKMPPQRRLVFEMSRHRGMSYDQIAAELGISPGTVAQHITAALKTIREVLALFILLFGSRF